MSEYGKSLRAKKDRLIALKYGRMILSDKGELGKRARKHQEEKRRDKRIKKEMRTVFESIVETAMNIRKSLLK